MRLLSSVILLPMSNRSSESVDEELLMEPMELLPFSRTILIVGVERPRMF